LAGNIDPNALKKLAEAIKAQNSLMTPLSKMWPTMFTQEYGLSENQNAVSVECEPFGGTLIVCSSDVAAKEVFLFSALLGETLLLEYEGEKAALGKAINFECNGCDGLAVMKASDGCYEVVLKGSCIKYWKVECKGILGKLAKTVEDVSKSVIGTAECPLTNSGIACSFGTETAINKWIKHKCVDYTGQPAAQAGVIAAASSLSLDSLVRAFEYLSGGLAALFEKAGGLKSPLAYTGDLALVHLVRLWKERGTACRGLQGLVLALLGLA